MDYILDQVEGGYDEVPAEEHFETAMDGMIDTVEIAGVENFSGAYSYAQRYLWSCLESSDTINHIQRRQGLEGLVTDGLAAGWEFIKKLFAGIWKFFFGDGEDSVKDDESKTTETVKKNEEALKEAASDTTGETVKKAKSKAQKIQKDPKATPASRSKAKSVEDRIDAAMKGKLPIKIDGKKFLEEIIEANKPQGEQTLAGAIAAVETVVKKAQETFKTDRSSEFKTPDGPRRTYYRNLKSGRDIFGTFLEDTEWKSVKKVKDLNSGQVAQHHLLNLMNMLKAATENFRKEKNSVNDEIKAAEVLVRGNKNKGQDKEMKDSLADLKILGTQLTQVHSTMKQFFAAIRRTSDEVNKFCCVK